MMEAKCSIDDKVDNTMLQADNEMLDLKSSTDQNVDNTMTHLVCSTDKVENNKVEVKCSTDDKVEDNKADVGCSTDDKVDSKTLQVDNKIVEVECSTDEKVENSTVEMESCTDDKVNNTMMEQKCSTNKNLDNKVDSEIVDVEYSADDKVENSVVEVECSTDDRVNNTMTEQKCNTDDKVDNKVLQVDNEMAEAECSTDDKEDNNMLQVDNEMVERKGSADDQVGNKILQVESSTCDLNIVKQTTETELPDWFKVMIGLTHGIHDGKEIKQAEDIAETIDIHGSTQAITIQTNERLFQLIMKRLHRITRRQRRSCTCTPDFANLKESIKRKRTKDKEINNLVENLLEPLVQIDDVNVSCEDVKAVCHKGGVPVLHMRCMSCQSLYRVVTALNSPLFKDGIIRIRDCLEQEMKDKLDIDANITPTSIQDVKHHLHEQGIITNTEDFLSCGVHPGKLTKVYCFQHSDVCCMTCAELQHSSCEGVKHVESEEKRSVILSKVKEYNVRLHTEHNEDGNCDIIACCALPNGETILADMNNKRLKKLNKELKVIDHCDLPDCPRDICFMGNNKLAVTLFDPGIQFVDISGSMELMGKVHLDHDCYGLTFYSDTLFITDPMSVFMYDTEGNEKGVLYRQIAGNHTFCKIAISDDGEKLYIAAREAGLVTIDKEGNRLSALHKDDMRYVSDVCVAGDGSLLTCNYRKQTVSRADSEGKMLLGRIAERSDDMYMPQSLCYDRYSSRLIVGHLHDDYISVLDFK